MVDIRGEISGDNRVNNNDSSLYSSIPPTHLKSNFLIGDDKVKPCRTTIIGILHKSIAGLFAYYREVERVGPRVGSRIHDRGCGKVG